MKDYSNTRLTFTDWLIELEGKPKFYIWTAKQKRDFQEACLHLNEVYLYLRSECQDIKYEKAVEILEQKYML